MSDILIRAAEALDLPAVIMLWRDLQEINAAYDPRLALNAQAEAWFLGYLRDNLDNPNMAVYVAEAQNTVVGYTFGQIMQRPTLLSGDCGYIADVCVRDGWRRQGTGRQLHSRLRAWFVSRGITAVEVQVVRANPASQAFWRKMGYNDFLRTLRSE
jgi:GNAT superfamily N-acetyltransferase